MNATKKRILIVGLSTALLTAAGGTLAYAGHKGHHGCDRDGRFGPGDAVQRLDNLSETQQTQLQQIREEVRATSRELREAMKETRSELRSAMRSDANLDAIRNLAAQSGEQKTEMIVLKAQARKKMAAVLTEEQREQLAEMRADFKHGRRHHERMRDF